MTKILDVYFHEKIAGRLEQDNHGEINFTYSPDWLNNPESARISCSLPLREGTFNRRECQGFFGGILPEDVQRKMIAKNLGISPNNDFSMLEKIGGECAGALTFVTSGEKLNPQDREYKELTGSILPGILRELPTRPLLAGEENIRLSLAGVQAKIAVYIDKNRMFIPFNNAPSTHILKPDFSSYGGVIFNEAFCLNLAKKIGLSVAEIEIRNTEDINYLLVKRYDRTYVAGENNVNQIIRIHQEDFCQALGILSSNKYQNEGGPSLKQIFDLLRKESSAPVIELEKMINAVIFNFLIGNCDAHGKNFSFLYLDGIKLAPLYDLISTLYYKDLDKKMAMKLGGEYHINKISIANFDVLANEVGLAKPEVRRKIQILIDAILSFLPSMEAVNDIQSGVSDMIKERCEYVAALLRSNK